MAGIRHRKDAWVVFAFLIVVQIICLRGTQRLRAGLAPQTSDTAGTLWSKRSELPSLDPTVESASITAASDIASPGASATHESQPTQPPKKDHDADKKPKQTECQPVPVHRLPAHVCRHIIKHCEPSGHLDYLRFYYCAGVEGSAAKHREPSQPPTEPSPWQPGISVLRLLALVAILLWMLFLFSWVGIVASDFFCPNLSTIASRLGLNESTAGVTFLAFGNGSPDVFSTFGAMKTDSGSLAIGELLGAASFIVSVICGSMMLIKPFKVKAWPFYRDVGFFTVAVALILAFLFDSKLKRSETIALICVYVLYALTVIVGSWWQERRSKQERRLATAREGFDNQADSRSVHSHHSGVSGREGGQNLLAPPSAHPQRFLSPSEYDPDFDPLDNWAGPRASNSGASTPDPGSRPASLHTPEADSRAAIRGQLNVRPNMVPRHSLLSAIEFRDVVHSLRHESTTDRSQEIFQTWDPERFLPHHHHHHTHTLLSRKASRETMGAAGSPIVRRAEYNRKLSAGPASAAAFVRNFSMTPGPRLKTFGALDSLETSAESRGQTQAPESTAGPSVEAGTVEDPWREHLPGDACEPLISPALPIEAVPRHDPLHQAELRKTLPRLQIPQWDTKATRIEQSQPKRPAPVREPSRQASSIQAHISPVAKNHLDSFSSQRRVRPDRSAPQMVAWKVRVVFNSFFPALRHLHAKSWLGAAVSIVTSPAILLLNLTLPVVDDEAERAELEHAKAAADELGAVRLEGEETQLRAEVAADESPAHDAGPSLAWTMQDDTDAAGHTQRDANTQRDREIASALQHLPSHGGSPFSFGSGSNKAAGSHNVTASPMPLEQGSSHQGEDQAETAYTSDDESCLEEEAEEQEMRRSIRRCLILCQAICAPTFVTYTIVSSSGAPRLGLKTGIAAAGGAVLACSAFWSMRRRDSGKARYSDRTLSAVAMLRCSMGFVVSVMWIMSIVDEVVSILQTVGMIVGLSDAILGLTVFAVGNSLGDFVANITIARLGHPVMAISACFAGPMLNLLLGIGISGTWLLSDSQQHGRWSQGAVPGTYPIDFNPTLLVSGLGLLMIIVTTFIAVPLNNFELTKGIGLSLIAAYVVIMTLNLLTEIFWVRNPTVF